MQLLPLRKRNDPLYCPAIYYLIIELQFDPGGTGTLFVNDGLSCIESLSSISGLLIRVEMIKELIKLLSQQCQEATCLGKKTQPCSSKKLCACVSPSKQLLGLFLSPLRVNQPSASNSCVMPRHLYQQSTLLTQGADSSRREQALFMFVRGLQGRKGSHPFCQCAVAALGKTVLFLVLPWPSPGTDQVSHLFVPVCHLLTLPRTERVVFWGWLSVTWLETVLLCYCQFHDRYPSSSGELLQLTSLPQGLPTLFFIVSIPLMTSPSCTFFKLSNPPHLQHCIQKLQVHP